jgi:hypothetical protein
METDRLEEVCKQLRLSHIPRVIETEGFETKEDWLLFLLENELKCRRTKDCSALQTGQIPGTTDFRQLRLARSYHVAKSDNKGRANQSLLYPPKRKRRFRGYPRNWQDAFSLCSWRNGHACWC